jgi:hypothetical protein
MLPPATDKDDWSNSYPISERFRESYDNIMSRWRVNPLHVFDTNEDFLKIHDFEVSLRGSLVLVYFELKHYAIKDRRTNGIGTNTFSATATQVQILERAAVKNPSPYKSLLTKGPKHLPQSPKKRQEQINAVRAFHPGNSPIMNFAAVATGSRVGAGVGGHLTIKGPKPPPQAPSTISVEAPASNPGSVLFPLDSESHQNLPNIIFTLANAREKGEGPVVRASSKADGKKRAVDEDGEGTATEEESPIAESPSKRKRKQVKT